MITPLYLFVNFLVANRKIIGPPLASQIYIYPHEKAPHAWGGFVEAPPETRTG